MLAWMPAFAGMTEVVIPAKAGIQYYPQRALYAIHSIIEMHSVKIRLLTVSTHYGITLPQLYRSCNF